MPSAFPYLMVPCGAASSSLVAWVGGRLPRDHTHRVEIEHRPSGRRWPVREWQHWTVPGSDSGISYARVTLNALNPGTTYPLHLSVNGQVLASASASTLPVELPPVTERPFTILLGSCFSAIEDDVGNVGRAFVRLPGAIQPAIKLLVGDQVYLDSPWYKFIVPHSESRLAASFLQQYMSTWTQQADAQGFNLLLRSGATYFCGDDHEFWNNVPFPGSFVVDTWTPAGRDVWMRLAASLYRAFQTDATFTGFDIGTLSLRIADTRLHRSRDRSRFMSDEDMERLRQWVNGLRGPGILALSQPVFAGRAGFGGRFADWQLADFTQYAELCRVLQASRQSIIIACGDVHFGRIARATLRSGAELVEVISSPMSLVDPLAKGSWATAPDHFPAEPIPGVASVHVTTEPTWVITDNHFVTMELQRDGGGLRARMRAWPTGASAMGAAGPEAEFVLKKEAS